ncbi:MAG: helix-turn-helix transcriptional regulator [Alphaproteobacteria bacterium]|nr:helix-turn-helix transcriptional regulator [Alphaproteobacteria bacterium]
MKPLTHPHIDDITVEGILHAFSNPARIQIYAAMAAAECPQCCSAYLSIKGKILPKSTLSQHFAILRESGLIRSERRGNEIHNTTRCDELDKKFGGMIDGILDAYLAQSLAVRKKKR